MDNSNHSKRFGERFDTAIIVDIGLSTWNPFVKTKGALIDLSFQGFKIKFVGKEHIKVKNGAILSLKIPIEQFKINDCEVLNLKATVKWFDERRQKIGGVIHESRGLIAENFEKLLFMLAEMKNKDADLFEGLERELDLPQEKTSIAS